MNTFIPIYRVKATFNKFHKHRKSDISLIIWVSYRPRPYFSVQTTRMSFINITILNLIVASRNFLFASELSVHQYYIITHGYK
jgi:hypothetical protein